MGVARPRGRSSSTYRLPARPRAERLLLGVCAGLSRRLDVDVTLVRLAFLLLALAWGLGVVLYLALWLVSPNDDGTPPRSLGDAVRRNLRAVHLDVARSRRRLGQAWGRADSRAWPRPFDRRWFAIALITAGISIMLASLGLFGWLTPFRALGLAVAVAGVAILLTLRST